MEYFDKNATNDQVWLVISVWCNHRNMRSSVCGNILNDGFSINDVLKIQDESTLLRTKTCMYYLLAYAYRYMWEIQASLKNALLLWVNTYVAYGSKMVPGVFWIINCLTILCSKTGKLFIQNLVPHYSVLTHFKTTNFSNK